MKENDLTFDEVVERLKKLDPSAFVTLNTTTVWRHANGLIAPPTAMQGSYVKLTGGGVTPNDWLALWNDPESVKARADVAATRERKKAAAA